MISTVVTTNPKNQHSLNLLDHAVAKAPYATYKFLREKHPVCQVAPHNMWAISRYEDVRFALQHPEIFSSTGCHKLLQPEWMKDNYLKNYKMVFEDPPQHTQHRRLVNKSFTNQAINNLAPTMREIAQSLADNMHAQTPLDFLQCFAYPYVAQVTAHLMGIKQGEHFKTWREWAMLLEKPPAKSDPGYAQELKKNHDTSSNYVANIVERQGGCPLPGLIGRLTETHLDGEPLSKEVIDELVELLILAGLQPVTHLLCFALIELAQDSKLLQRLLDQPEDISRFIEELLRYNSPVHFTPRRTLSPVTLSGVTIPADAPVLLINASANRDPEQFPQPDSIDLSRPNLKTQLGFGLGIHHCLGAALARVETKVALETLLTRFKQINCPTLDRLPWFYNLVIYGVRQLPVSFR